MRLTIRARLIQYAIRRGVDALSAVNDTLAIDFAARCKRRST